MNFADTRQLFKMSIMEKMALLVDLADNSRALRWNIN